MERLGEGRRKKKPRSQKRTSDLGGKPETKGRKCIHREVLVL